MEKISSIVPRSKRVASTDLASASAVRPGAPSFGRPMGTSTSGVKDQLTTAQRAVAEQQRMNDARKQSALTPDLVEDMTNRFFLHRMTVAPAEVPVIGIQPALPRIEPPKAAAPQVETAPHKGDVASPSEPIEEIVNPTDEYVPVGTYIDVEA